MLAQVEGANKGSTALGEFFLCSDPYVIRCWGYIIQLLGPRLFESDLINTVLKIPEVGVQDMHIE